ncbi:MAG: class I SAM-dependent methyltransferase [Humidesulfovibrio sp.]|nr:class I SAM-dependent methyltransferase [Humidesulfovibrio sp.]
MSQETRKVLDSSAEAYKDKTIANWENLYRQKIRRLFEVFVSFFPQRQVLRALELGLADGEMTQHILRYFSHATLVDGAKAHVDETGERARGLGLQNFTGVHALFEEFTPDEVFDVIFMAHVLEHMDDAIGLLRRATEWLAPDGIMCLAVPNSNSLHRHVGVQMGMLKRCDSLHEQDLRVGHKRVYSPELFRGHVREAGLREVKYGGLMVKPLSNRQVEAQWSEELINAFFGISDIFPDICSEIYIIAGR